MAAKVVKLAQPGIDVKTAGDEHLVYNSNWPLLKIYKQGSASINSFPEAGGGAINKIPVATHDLGYFPAFWWFANFEAREWDTYTGQVANRAEFNGPLRNTPSMTDSQFIYWYISNGNQTKAKFYYYIFALDITKPYTAPQIKSGGVIGPRNTQTVFKLAKPGKDVSSSNLEDYTVNSLARSPMVHAVYPGVVGADASIPGGSGFTFYHNLGYVPLFFAYMRTGLAPEFNIGFNGYILLSPDGTGSSGFIIDEQKIQYFDANTGRHVSLLVLKDPFEVSNTVAVTI